MASQEQAVVLEGNLLDLSDRCHSVLGTDVTLTIKVSKLTSKAKNVYLLQKLGFIECALGENNMDVRSCHFGFKNAGERS